MLTFSALSVSLIAVAAAARSKNSQVGKMEPSPALWGAHMSEDGGTTSVDAVEANLMNWMREHGAQGTEGLRFQTFLKGDQQLRGVGATKRFQNGDVVMRIPESLILHAHDEKTADVDQMALALVAERRKGPDSFWAPYIQVIPSPDDYKKFYPTFVDAAHLQAHTDLPSVPGILHRQENLEKLYPAYKSKRDFSDLSWDELRWADAASISREFGSDEYGSAMVPLLDMLNTAEPSNIRWQRHMEDGFLVIRAARDIEAGEELTDSYQVSSPKDNERFLTNYGFVLNDNPTKLQLPSSNATRPECTGPLKSSDGLPKAFLDNLEKLRREHCNR